MSEVYTVIKLVLIIQTNNEFSVTFVWKQYAITRDRKVAKNKKSQGHENKYYLHFSLNHLR